MKIEKNIFIFIKIFSTSMLQDTDGACTFFFNIFFLKIKILKKNLEKKFQKKIPPKNINKKDFFFQNFFFQNFFFKNFYFEETTIEKNVWAPSASLFTIFYICSLFLFWLIFLDGIFFLRIFISRKKLLKKKSTGTIGVL